jgi:flagellar biosynthesis anti-sigma factor FlgM
MGIDGIQGKPERPQVEWRSSQRPEAAGRSAAGPNDGADQVQFSAQTQEFMRVRKLVSGVPDVRHDRVEQLRQEIRLGKYRVPAEDIADAIVRQNLIDRTDI